ncbi:hypothetical protein GQ457_08G024440 [Hibiscus cannabinus]
MLYEGLIQRIEDVFTFVRAYHLELEQVSYSHCHPRRRRHDNDKWIPPPPSSYKINVDASFRSIDNVSCSGIIVGDFEAEILALLQGLDFARDLGLRLVIAKGDNKSVISKLNSSLLSILLSEMFLLERWFFLSLWRLPVYSSLLLRAPIVIFSSERKSQLVVVLEGISLRLVCEGDSQSFMPRDTNFEDFVELSVGAKPVVSLLMYPLCHHIKADYQSSV